MRRISEKTMEVSFCKRIVAMIMMVSYISVMSPVPMFAESATNNTEAKRTVSVEEEKSEVLISAEEGGIVTLGDASIEIIGNETKTPKEGDIMIQRDSNGDVFHSATVLRYDKKNNTVLVKEAMGSIRFKADDEKFYDVNYQWYKINPDRDTFYKRQENAIITENSDEKN